MHLINVFAYTLLLAPGGIAASSWTFDDASLSIQAKSAGVGGGVKERLSPKTPLTSNAISLSTSDSLKITLTTQDGKTAKKPHQAFLQLQDTVTGLQDSFSISVKDNGKAKVEITQKDLPAQLRTSSKPLQASIIVASFGSSEPFKQHVFDLAIESDPNTPTATPPRAERYSVKPEIHHIFRQDPKSPPRVISLFFTLAVIAALPTLFGAWLFLGANAEHTSKAFGANPIAHGLFFGSVVAMEGVFFFYYKSWNLFQTLPVAAVVGVVAYVSGSRALTEVQERRLAGER